MVLLKILPAVSLDFDAGPSRPANPSLLCRSSGGRSFQKRFPLFGARTRRDAKRRPRGHSSGGAALRPITLCDNM